jgi:hypothetical protein
MNKICDLRGEFCMKKTHETIGYKYESEKEEDAHITEMKKKGWSIHDYSIYLHVEYIKFEK